MEQSDATRLLLVTVGFKYVLYDALVVMPPLLVKMKKTRSARSLQ
jgi:hypothetical protein